MVCAGTTAAKNGEGFRGGRLKAKKFRRGRGRERLVEEGVETPADNLGDGWRGLRVPERERRVIVVRGKNREGGTSSDGEVGMVGDDQEWWR